MQKIIVYAIAAGFILNTGCSKQEEPVTQSAPPNEAVSTPIQVVPETPAQNVKPVKEQLTEKAVAVKEQAVTTAKEITEKAQAAGAEAVQNIKSAVTVTSADVLADLNLSMDEVKAKASAYKLPELTAYANGYKDVLLEKKAQLTALADQLKGLPVAEMLGGKGKEIKTQLSQYTGQLSALKERYSVYLDLLKNFGVDLSAYGL